MAFLVLAIVALVVAVVGLLLPKDIPDGVGGSTGTGVFRAILIALGGIGFLLLLPASACHQVNNGNVGLVYEFGKIQGQTGSGLVWTAPWQNVKSANVQEQKLCFTDNEAICEDGGKIVGEGLDSFSRESQNVFIDASLNIRIDPANIQNLYTNVGENYVEKLIASRVNQVFKDETVNFAAVDIAPNRDVIKDSVEKKLRDQLAAYSITLIGIFIDNIAFSPEFEASIEAKQVATQAALAAQERIKQSEAEAQQRIATARGEAESLRITAEGQAAANAELNASLTPALIQFQAIQKLADDISVIMVPSGSNFILPSSVFGP